MDLDMIVLYFLSCIPWYLHKGPKDEDIVKRLTCVLVLTLGPIAFEALN
jgi:hypothetical protein